MTATGTTATGTTATGTTATGTTATGPTAGSVARTIRGPALVVAALVLVTAVLALLAGSPAGGELDPRSYSPGGTHALAALLEHGGTSVRVVTTAGQAAQAAQAATTLVVPFPDGLSRGELTRLSGLPGGLLLLGAGQDALDGLDLPAIALGRTVDGVRRPACPLAVAVRAGTVRLSGVGYGAGARTGARTNAHADAGASPVADTGTACYGSGGRAGLLALPGHRVLLGSADLLTNQRLADEGDAALALGLLGGSEQVLWLLPSGSAVPAGDRKGLLELLPTSFLAATTQLALAVVVLALWRGRRLGRVVAEPLPVVVRAAETVEGHGRLYRAAQARDVAADALREASRDTATRRLGLSAGGAGLVEAAAARSGRPAADVQRLLYGPVPVDDAALERLADDLTRFDREVAGL